MLLAPQDPLSAPIPLVLDLDGTVIHTDTFHEMMVSLLLQKPMTFLRLPFWFLKGRAYAKAQLVEHVDIGLEMLPYNKHLLAFAQKELSTGRPLILATGTDQKLAQKISSHLGIFQEVIGSDGRINMTGYRKQKALLDRFGIHGFDYAGDSPIDTHIWQVSRKALVVCPKWGVLKKVRALKDFKDIHYIPREKVRAFALFCSLRPLFWLLNFAAASMSFFMGLSFLASGLLILGDLLTLERERKGRGKQSVFAQGHLHLLTAFILVPLLILPALFFLLSLPGSGFYIGIYTLLFITLDRLTRWVFQPFRWAVLGFLQLLTALLIGL